MTTLNMVRAGQRCRVEALNGPPALTQRLMEFGVFDGETLVVIGTAPLGDPLEIDIAGTRLSLRLADAACVRVSLTP